MSSRFAWILFSVLFGAGRGAVAAPEGTPAEASNSATIASVWKQHKLDFHYFGRTSRYSCDGMSDKVRMLLTQMGARRDMKLFSYGCEIGHIRLDGINPGLSIEFWAAAPAGAADKVAAVPGAKPGDAKPADAKSDDARLLDARYQPFGFRQDAFRNLDIGDCELVEEFVRQVLPKFATRGVKQDIACIPYQVRSGSYRVSGEVLKAVIRPADGANRG